MIKGINTVEDYIKNFPDGVQGLLIKIRQIIKEKAPESVETISYGMPVYKLNNKPLVYFAAYKNHIGFYATPTGHQKFIKELSEYKQGKGSVQFLINEPIPYDLIGRIVEFRVKENETKK